MLIFNLFFIFPFLIMFLFTNIVQQQAYAEKQVVSIPLGSYNPNFDTPAPEWYEPPVITIQTNDTVTWLNNDKETHTVTSGTGSGRTGLLKNTFGNPDGYFDSKNIPLGNQWSFVFDKAGTFPYFCTIHPWMVGYVQVDEPQGIAYDIAGNELKFPLIRYTQDRLTESDLTWEPHLIRTGQKIIFIYQFYEVPTSRHVQDEYTLAILQNGRELFRSDGSTSLGGDYRYFVFSEPGPATFRFENIGGRELSTEYSTMVYENPSGVKTNYPIVEPARNIVLHDYLIPLFFTPTFIMMDVIVFLIKRGMKKTQ